MTPGTRPQREFPVPGWPCIFYEKVISVLPLAPRFKSMFGHPVLRSLSCLGLLLPKPLRHFALRRDMTLSESPPPPPGGSISQVNQFKAFNSTLTTQQRKHSWFQPSNQTALAPPPPKTTPLLTSPTRALLILDLHPLLLPVRLPGNHLLPRLGNRPQHLVVVEPLARNDRRRLRLEGHVVGLDAWDTPKLSARGVWRVLGVGGGSSPSSLFSTRSTAPEHPPQDMATLNL